MNLPGFISFNTAKPAEYSAAQLPSVFGGTPIGVNGEDMSKATISNIFSDHLPMRVKRRQLDLVQAMNHDHLSLRADDAQLEGVIQTMELGFRMQAADVAARITPQSRMIFLNTPHNPTGAILRRDEIAALGALVDAP